MNVHRECPTILVFFCNSFWISHPSAQWKNAFGHARFFAAVILLVAVGVFGFKVQLSTGAGQWVFFWEKKTVPFSHFSLLFIQHRLIATLEILGGLGLIRLLRSPLFNLWCSWTSYFLRRSYVPGRFNISTIYKWMFDSQQNSYLRRWRWAIKSYFKQLKRLLPSLTSTHVKLTTRKWISESSYLKLQNRFTKLIRGFDLDCTLYIYVYAPLPSYCHTWCI